MHAIRFSAQYLTSSQIGYCNLLYYNLPNRHINRLPYTQNALPCSAVKPSIGHHVIGTITVISKQEAHQEMRYPNVT